MNDVSNEQRNSQNFSMPTSISTRWSSIDGIKTVYVNELAISHTGREFYLVFGEAQVPVTYNPAIDPVPTEIPVQALFKMAVSPENMLRFLDLLNANVEKFLIEDWQSTAPTSDSEAENE